jgi:beta-carotene hydroxylase
VDVRTAALIVGMAAGLVATAWLQHAGRLPGWAAFLVGTWLMNLSFTAWHEPAHQTFARSRRLNTAAGWLASCASVYPGYFARRREHLGHHRYEGQAGHDPVYPRIQSTFWRFPLTLLRTVVTPERVDLPPGFLPLTRGQRLADGASHAVVLAVVAGAAASGWLAAVTWAWLLPRLAVYGLHAYYICFFPHSVPGGGYQVLRLREDRLLLRALTVNQHLHGIHHRWPWIPWHRYRRVLRECAEDLRREGMLGPAAPIATAGPRLATAARGGALDG